ncbi:MAG: Gfo/Idh/MocA family oxidoreductase, partial [Bacteroidia bacterium]|nr:Gfo/Idh/MocA family oxidoreductase [Bacteroidia bacterium]
MKRRIFLFAFLLCSIISESLVGQTNEAPLRVGVIGLTHDHVNGILRVRDRKDIEIVGIVEPNQELALRYSKKYGYSMDLVYKNMEDMIKATKPEAVSAFGSTYEHLNVVEVCAPKGIHIMVEKPLAVSLEHAKKMEALVRKHNVQLLTNYETTWYATNHKTYDMVRNGDVGELRKIVVRDGHQGPSEIGVSKEFLEWLTDPVANGGGALMDFGCYGANLITWLNNGKKPESVMAVAQTIKPERYPNVEDEATIILQYPKMQGIIEASWNWPMGRKDMEVYGKSGYIYSDNRKDIRYRLNEGEDQKSEILESRSAPYDDPFAMLAAVVRNKVRLQ